MSKGLATVFFLIMFIHPGRSQVGSDSIDYSVKGEYIQKYPNRITARALYTNTYNSYVVREKGSGERFELEPNKQQRFGASVSYSFLTLAYSFAPDFLSANKDNEDSRLFSLNLRAFFGKWTQAVDIYNEKGFYETYSGVYFPRTRNLKVGGSTSYVFNDHFSFRAISNQDERQVKSAGSFVAGVTYYYSKFTLFAESDKGKVDEDFYYFDLAFTPSYHYNFVPFEHFLISVGVKAGIGLNHSRSDYENSTSLLALWGVSTTSTIDLDNFFFGARFNYTALNHDTDSTSYTEDNISFFNAFIGYRFKAPKKWVQGTEKLKGKLNF